MLFFHLLVISIDQTCTHYADGVEFNISLGNFGHVGEMSFFRAFRSDKNGIQKNGDFEVGDIVLLKEGLGRNK